MEGAGGGDVYPPAQAAAGILLLLQYAIFGTSGAQRATQCTTSRWTTQGTGVSCARTTNSPRSRRTTEIQRWRRSTAACVNVCAFCWNPTDLRLERVEFRCGEPEVLWQPVAADHANPAGSNQTPCYGTSSQWWSGIFLIVPRGWTNSPCRSRAINHVRRWMISSAIGCLSVCCSASRPTTCTAGHVHVLRCNRLGVAAECAGHDPIWGWRRDRHQAVRCVRPLPRPHGRSLPALPQRSARSGW